MILSLVLLWHNFCLFQNLVDGTEAHSDDVKDEDYTNQECEQFSESLPESVMTGLPGEVGWKIHNTVKHSLSTGTNI